MAEITQQIRYHPFLNLVVMLFLGSLQSGISEEFSKNSQLNILSETLNKNESDKCWLNEFIHSKCQKTPDFLPEVQKGKWRPLLFSGLLLWMLCTCFLYTRSRRISKKAKDFLSKFPGPKPLPIIGNVHVFAGCSDEDLWPKVDSLITTYGRRILIWIFNLPAIFLFQAKDVEKVLSSTKHIQKGKQYDVAVKWILGEGLISSSNETWQADRKLMTPSFKYQKFHGFLDSFNKHGKILVDILAHKTFDSGQNLFPLLALCNMDSVLESTFGVNSNLQTVPNSKLIQAAVSGGRSMRMRTFKPYLALPVITDVFGRGKEEREVLRTLTEFFKTVTDQRNLLLASNELENEITKPFIDVLMNRRSEQNIFDHMVTIFVASFETTASAMNYALYLLALHPEHQAKVHEELDMIFGNNRDSQVTFDNLAEIKYLEMCIKEALRLYPTAPIMTRLINSDLELDDATIPEGTEVVIDIYNLHRDPEVFPDPERFDPHRFLPEACAKRSLYAYVPFSMGPRSCLGQKYGMMQLKVVLSFILRNFSVTTTLKREDSVPLAGILLVNSGPIPLKLTRRQI